MTMPLMVGLVVGALTLIALAIYANRPQSQRAQHAAAQPGSDGYVPMMFGDSSASTADCGGDGGASDGGGGCGDGGGGGGGD